MGSLRGQRDARLPSRHAGSRRIPSRCGTSRNLLAYRHGKAGAVGTPVASGELAEEIRWFLNRNVKMAFGTAANPAPAVCLMADKSRRSLEEILTKRKGGGSGEKRAFKDIRDDMKKFGVDMGDDRPNVMIAWVGPGQAGDTRDDNVMRKSMSEEGESVFRRMMSSMGVIPLSWSSTRALMPMVSDWRNSGVVSVASDKSRGQHCYLAMVAILVSLLPLDIDLPRERERATQIGLHC